MKATVNLYQEGGVSGPRATIDTTLEGAVKDAIAWAQGQTGHPWDVVLVTVYADDDEGQQRQIATHDIECRAGVWKCV